MNKSIRNFNLSMIELNRPRRPIPRSTEAVKGVPPVTHKASKSLQWQLMLSFCLFVHKMAKRHGSPKAAGKWAQRHCNDLKPEINFHFDIFGTATTILEGSAESRKERRKQLPAKLCRRPSREGGFCLCHHHYVNLWRRN